MDGKRARGSEEKRGRRRWWRCSLKMDVAPANLARGGEGNEKVVKKEEDFNFERYLSACMACMYFNYHN
ncbi:hypothetical protein Csa_001494 [Cucumis sativus]|uniref:Uncharacterized protein n=1 Tax=Cucumis sativus TaxID=3659 RepID=A0A0A0LDV3_CUCSA|nr:hypothetical protein Csa_001494 [Cucumis sativus]